MPNPNPELQAALTQFATQPGVSPEQSAQLRAAVTGSSALLNKLNQDAHAGHLTGFAIESAGSTSNLIGKYDLQTGVMTLPASSFQATGIAPSSDLKTNIKLQDMSIRFGHSSITDQTTGTITTVSKDMLDNLQASINGSPVLAQQIKSGVSAHLLENFTLLDPNAGAGGSYDGTTKTMNLPASSLQPTSANNPQGFNINDMTFVLGHEMQHGFNHTSKMAAFQNFNTQALPIAQSNNPIHDYTAPIGKLIQAGREDEAKAEIAGWNALLSHEKQLNPSAGLNDMYQLRFQTSRVLDFVEANPTLSAAPGTLTIAQAKPGINFNPTDSSLPQTPNNIEAMGAHYFDKQSAANFPNLPASQTSHLGFYKESNYQNYYGGNAITNAISIERMYSHPINGVAPQLHINMSQLHLEERLIERLGMTIVPNPNTPQKYYDTSQNPPAVHHFDHTNTTGTPTSHQHVPVAPNPPSNQMETNLPGNAQAPAAIQPGMTKSKSDGAETPDQGLPKKSAELNPKDSLGLETMLAAVRKDGRWDEDQSKNIAAAAMVGHASDTLQQRIDSVKINERGDVFSVYSPHGDKGPHFHSQVNGHEVAQVPAEQSLNQVVQARQQQQQEAQVLAQQKTQQQNQDGPILQQSGGMTMNKSAAG
jgi:hypothetical protein